MAAQRTQPFITPDEYLAIERAAEYKNEFISGEIVAMSGASNRHETIVMNLARDLGNALRGQPCKPKGGNLRVRVRQTSYLYPDLTVVCGEPEFADSQYLDTLLNPALIFEILSDSTESRDRGIKRRLYQQIESLQHYVLIEQAKADVEVYTRQSGGDWLLHSVSGLEATFSLASIDVILKMADLYEGVEMMPDPASS